MTPLSITETAAELRRRMRKARRALPTPKRYQLAQALSRRASGAGLLRSGQRVAIYVPVDGEMPTGPLLAIAGDRGCRLFLPRITSARAHRMTFAPMRPPFRPNRYAIPEPLSLQGSVSARWLDLVIVPLVAFDAAGTRLGSGAGYYDRALAHLALRQSWRRPKVVGVAFDFQQVTALERKPWDIPMDLVITDRTVFGTCP